MLPATTARRSSFTVGPRRKQVLVVGLSLLAGLVIVILSLALRDGGPAADKAISPAANPRDAAHDACADISVLYQQLVANAPAEKVFATASRAKARADAAAAGDARWIQLDSAVQSVAQALHTDSADLAGLGIEILRSNCASLGVPLPVPSH